MQKSQPGGKNSFKFWSLPQKYTQNLIMGKETYKGPPHVLVCVHTFVLVCLCPKNLSCDYSNWFNLEGRKTACSQEIERNKQNQQSTYLYY